MRESGWTRTWAMVVVLACAAAAAGQRPDGRAAYREGEVLVKFKRGLTAGEVDAVAAGHGLRTVRTFRGLTARHGQRFAHLSAKGRTTEELLRLLATDPRVEAVAPNHLRYLTPAWYPNDPHFSDQWYLHNTGQVVNATSGLADADVDAPEAWRMLGTPTDAVVVGVVDSGIYHAHQDLASALWVNTGENPANGLDDDGNGYTNDVYGYDFAGDYDPNLGIQLPPDPCPLDVESSSHGTHVAGTIAAVANNGRGVAGVCAAKVMALKVVGASGGSIASADVVEALDYATTMKGRGVPIVAVNCSFGGFTGYNFFEDRAIVDAGAAGIIVCAAAGNNAANIDLNPFYPASYARSNMIVVAASTSRDQLALFSNYGSNTVDLASPGENIFSTVGMDPATDGTIARGPYSWPLRGLQYAGTTTGLTASARYCGLGYPTNFSAMSGRIAVIERGIITFEAKVRNAMAAGCVGAVIFNNVPGWLPSGGTLNVPTNYIPAAEMTQADGQALTSQIPTTVTLQLPADWDFKDGTSMATPVVAGAVALAAMRYPGDTMSERIARVVGSVDAKANLEGIVATGGRLNLANIVDADRDGVPDWWETEVFGSLTNAGAWSDADGDGFPDRGEFFAGTNPNDAESLLAITEPIAYGAGGMELHWTSESGHTYSVQVSTNLSAGFRDLASGVAASVPTNVYTDASATHGAVGLYRIVAE